MKEQGTSDQYKFSIEGGTLRYMSPEAVLGKPYGLTLWCIVVTCERGHHFQDVYLYLPLTCSYTGTQDAGTWVETTY